MTHQYVRHVREHLKEIDEMRHLIDRWLASHDPPPPAARRRLLMARQQLGAARLAFLATLGLLGSEV
ncbi:MAG: hypothetical protein ACM3UP_02515 [Methanocella sp.]